LQSFSNDVVVNFLKTKKEQRNALLDLYKNHEEDFFVSTMNFNENYQEMHARISDFLEFEN
jgi:hypothetical protein